MDKLIKRILFVILKLYQKAISPHFIPCCRFYPTCSEYAVQALDQFGVCRAIFLIGKRLLRCHPFAKGGVDFIPNDHR